MHLAVILQLSLCFFCGTPYKAISNKSNVPSDTSTCSADWFDSETDTSEELQMAEARLTKLRTMEKNLQQLYLEEDISHHDFKEHRVRIEAERSRLTNTVAAVRQRQNLVKADFEIALQLATELD